MEQKCNIYLKLIRFAFKFIARALDELSDGKSQSLTLTLVFCLLSVDLNRKHFKIHPEFELVGQVLTSVAHIGQTGTENGGHLIHNDND